MRCTTGDGGILVAVIDVIVHATGKTRQAASNTWARMLTTDAYATVACQTQRLTFVGYTKKSSVTPVVPISVALSVVDHVTDRDQSAVSDVHRAIIAHTPQPRLCPHRKQLMILSKRHANACSIYKIDRYTRDTLPTHCVIVTI